MTQDTFKELTVGFIDNIDTRVQKSHLAKVHDKNEYIFSGSNGDVLLTLSIVTSEESFAEHTVVKINGITENPAQLNVALQQAKWLKLEGFKLPDKVLSAVANGYNCWSDSPMLKADEILYGESDPNQYYFGDAKLYRYREQPGEIHAWSYTVLDFGDSAVNSIIAGICEDRFYHVIEIDMKAGTFNLLLEIESFDFNKLSELDHLLGGFIIPIGLNADVPLNQLAEYWMNNIRIHEFISRNQGSAWTGKIPVTGYTSWYNTFTDISEEWLIKHCDSVKKLTDWQVFQVDDGYQTCVGDWLIPAVSFPDSVDVVIRYANQKGLMPGIWIAPFVAMEQSQLLAKHPEIKLTSDTGEVVVCGDFEHWGGKFLALDVEHPVYQNYMEEVVYHFAEVGVKFIKADFLYASSMRAANGYSRAYHSSKAHQWFYDLCRKYDIFLLSCGAQMSSAYGRCDFSRIGADVAIEWEVDDLMVHKSRERPSATHSMNNTITRAFMNGPMFYNDPDVVILREENNELNAHEKRVLTELNHSFGGLVFSSDSPHLFGADEKVLLDIMQKDEPPMVVNKMSRDESQALTYVITDVTQKGFIVTTSPREKVDLKGF